MSGALVRHDKDGPAADNHDDVIVHAAQSDGGQWRFAAFA
jgi:hypothetical protein